MGVFHREMEHVHVQTAKHFDQYAGTEYVLMHRPVRDIL